jgi:hypothetical protein
MTLLWGQAIPRLLELASKQSAQLKPRQTFCMSEGAAYGNLNQMPPLTGLGHPMRFR